MREVVELVSCQTSDAISGMCLKGHLYFQSICKVIMNTNIKRFCSFMNTNIKRFSSFIFFDDRKLLGAYFIIKSGGFLNNVLRVAIYFTRQELLFLLHGLRVTFYM